MDQIGGKILDHDDRTREFTADIHHFRELNKVQKQVVFDLDFLLQIVVLEIRAGGEPLDFRQQPLRQPLRGLSGGRGACVVGFQLALGAVIVSSRNGIAAQPHGCGMVQIVNSVLGVEQNHRKGQAFKDCQIFVFFIGHGPVAGLQFIQVLRPGSRPFSTETDFDPVKQTIHDMAAGLLQG
jgi:hypothetical protein